MGLRTLDQALRELDLGRHDRFMGAGWFPEPERPDATALRAGRGL